MRPLPFSKQVTANRRFTDNRLSRARAREVRTVRSGPATRIAQRITVARPIIDRISVRLIPTAANEHLVGIFGYMAISASVRQIFRSWFVCHANGPAYSGKGVW